MGYGGEAVGGVEGGSKGKLGGYVRVEEGAEIEDEVWVGEGGFEDFAGEGCDGFGEEGKEAEVHGSDIEGLAEDVEVGGADHGEAV